MSAGSLNGGSLALSKLSVAGVNITGSGGGGGGITALNGNSGVPTTASVPTVTVGSITQTAGATNLGFVSSASGVVLSGNISSSGGTAGVASITGGSVTAPATGAITLVGAGGITVSGAGGAGGSITLTGSGGGGGGNWSYRGTFADNTAYALNDVAFSGVITTASYVCILAYTSPASGDDPSTNTTNWAPFATQLSTSASVVGGIPATGALTFTGAGVSQAGNTFTFSGGGGGGGGATLTGDAVGSVATNNTGNIAVSVSPTAQTGVLTTATTMVLPPAGAGGGGNWSYRGAFAQSTTYALNDVVKSLTTPAQSYVCILAYTSPASGGDPSGNTTNWQLFASSAGGAPGASILGTAAGSVATNTTGALTMSVSPTAQTGVLTTATTIVLPPAGAGGVTALTGDAAGSVPTSSASVAVSVSATAQTGVLTTANTMVLPPAGASGLPSPYLVLNRAWATTGTTDPITVTALPAGTYAVSLSWMTATAPVGLLTCPPPTAGGTTLQVVCGSSVTAGAGANYSVVVWKLT